MIKMEDRLISWKEGNIILNIFIKICFKIRFHKHVFKQLLHNCYIFQMKENEDERQYFIKNIDNLVSNMISFYPK